MSGWDWFWSCGGWILSALLFMVLYLGHRLADRKEAELDQQILEYVHAERFVEARKRGVGTPDIACPKCGAGTNLMCNMGNRYVD